MKDSLQSVLVITLFAIGGQLILIASHIAAAALFGATSDMDAFLAASAVPQYIVTVLLGSLGFIFIPLYVDQKYQGDKLKAHHLKLALFNNCILLVGLLSVVGIALTNPILHLTAPGLNGQSMRTGISVALVTWPAITATAALSVLTSVYQAEKKFAWQAAVPFTGSIINLVFLILLAPHVGILALAISTTVSAFIQVVLLIRGLTIGGKYELYLGWRSPELQQLVKLATPLVLVAIISKFSPIFDRFLASDLGPGNISYLNYGFKIVTILSLLISTGGTTVIFPRMALDFSTGDSRRLRETISTGLRLMGFVVLPIITITIPLASSLITLLFERGEFTAVDSRAVSLLLQIYLIALIPMCLSNITGKGFYVLQKTRIMAIIGAIETFAYVVYTYYLAQWLGVSGIAIGFVVYYNISLLWQLLVLNYKIGTRAGHFTVKSFATIAIAASAAGLICYGCTFLTSIPFLQVSLGGFVGLVVYLSILHFVASRELETVKELLIKLVKPIIIGTNRTPSEQD